MAQSISSFNLQNGGAFAVSLDFMANMTGTPALVKGTSAYPNPQSKTASPGDYGVPANTPVQIYADVMWGTHATGSEIFNYDPTSTACAYYQVTGTADTPSVKLITVGTPN